MSLISLLCVPLLSQEEEIPELEIDIDELLELPDEGQRSRLQVKTAQFHLIYFYIFHNLLLDNMTGHQNCKQMTNLSLEGLKFRSKKWDIITLIDPCVE